MRTTTEEAVIARTVVAVKTAVVLPVVAARVIPVEVEEAGVTEAAMVMVREVDNMAMAVREVRLHSRLLKCRRARSPAAVDVAKDCASDVPIAKESSKRSKV